MTIAVLTVAIFFFLQAFRQAWDKACSLKNAVFLVPEQRRYRVNATKFKGPCESRLIVQVRTLH